MKKFKRILSGVLAAAMTVSAASMISVGAANVSFTDVSGHWAWTNGQIPYLVEKGVLNGYEQSNGTYMFKPDGNVKRSEFIKMLDEVFGLEVTTSINYSDISASDWFYPYFQKAAAQGYLLDYGNKANPSGEITREEATALLVRYLDLPANEKAETSSLADYSTISDNYKEYVLRAVHAGVINGYNENGQTYFKPKKTLTRAEALTILYRAAGCIFNESAYNRDGDANDTNNVITEGNITINNVRLNGRNIITEGADSGKITFYDCDINGTLYIRGGADVTFNDCDVENVVVYGGGTVSLVSGTKMESLTLENKASVSIYSGTKVNTLSVEYGADKVRVTGDGSIGKAIIRARDFSSSMVPAEFEIGNNLNASFGSTEYEGSSDTQNAFEIAPFSSADKNSYYLNVLSAIGGEVYYYYTNLGTEPTISSFDSYYDQATCYGRFDITANEPVSASTYAPSTVSKFEFVALQIRDGSRKYAPILIQNHGDLTTGFATEPYLADATTIKFRASTSATLYWFYANDGKQLNQVEFLSTYKDKESALKGESSINNVQTFSCSLKEKYLENYSYVAFMLKTGANVYHTPVIVSVGKTGFDSLPAIKTPGIINFKANTAGDIYYYYSTTADLPAADKFKTAYNAAKHKDHNSIRANVSTDLNYDLDYIDDYPYLIMSIRDDNDKYMQPVCVDINFTTGFKNAPSVKNSSEIKFRTEERGEVKYYYTKDENVPSVDDFNKEYDKQSSKYKGKMTVSDMYETIEYKTSYAVTYPNMAIMFTDRDGKDYSPVLVELNATLNTGFTVAPYAEDGYVNFRTEESGEVWYFYSKDNSVVAPDDFEDYWDNEYNRDRAGSVNVSAGSKGSFKIDYDILKNYPYIVIAFTADEDSNPSFEFPFVLDVVQSEVSNVGSGLDVGSPSSIYDDVDVKALYSGKICWYYTDDTDDFPSEGKDFASRWNSISSGSSKTVERGEKIEIDFREYKYIVCALRVNGEYLSYVIIDKNEGVIDGGVNNDDLDYDIDDSGFYVKSTGRSSITVIPDEDGSLRFLINQFGTLIPIGDSIDVDEDDRATLDFPFMIDNDIVNQLFGGSNMELYLQFTDDDGNTYRPYKISLK